MRILIAAGVTPTVGGVSSHINSLCRALRAAGHEAVVVTPLGVSDEFRAINGRVSGILANFLHLPGGMLTAYFVSQYMLRTHLLHTLTSTRFDVVHAEDVSAANATLQVLSIDGPPLLLTVHGYLAAEAVADGRIRSGGWEESVLLNQERRAYSRVASVFSVARRLGEHICKVGGRTESISVIPNFVETDRFQPRPSAGQLERERLQIDKDAFVILCPRRLQPQYGIEFLIRALALLTDSCTTDSLQVLLAGTGDQAQTLRCLAESLGVSCCIRMLGQVPSEQMPLLYAAADVVVIPSISMGAAAEGTSVAALEAMACGRPVVASAIGGLLDVITNDVTGLLVPERDPSALAAAILRLQNDPSLAMRLGSAAAHHVRTQCASEVSAELYLRAYRRMRSDTTASLG